MSPDYVNIKILPEAKQAILNVTAPHETLSDTIIRVCTQHNAASYGIIQEPLPAEWKQNIDTQIAEIRIILARLEQKYESINEPINEPIITDIIMPPQTSEEQQNLHPPTTDAPVADTNQTNTTTGERRAVSEREKELFSSICKRGIELEGKQKTFIVKVRASNDSVVKNLKSNPGDIKTMNISDIEKLLEYARCHCPEVLEEYSDIMQCAA